MEEYRDLFLAEAQEYLQNMTNCLLELEKDPSDNDQLTEMFRAAHSLKGMAGTMGYELITELTHDLENMLDHLRSGEITVGTDLVNLLFEAEDMIRFLVDNLESQEEYQGDVKALQDKLKNWEQFSPEKAAEAAQAGQVSATETEAAEDKAEPAAKEAQPDGSSVPKAEDIKISDLLNEFEKETLKEGMFKGENIYYIHVKLREDSLLKSVRAYMVVKAVEAQGELIKAIPSVQDLEDENFQDEFTLLLMGNPEAKELQSTIESISEIDQAHITLLDVDEELELQRDEEVEAAAAQPEQKEQRAPVEEKKEQVGKEALAAKAKDEKGDEKASPAAKKSRAASSLNRSGDKTVRVETAKLDNLVNLVGELVINRTRVVELGKKTEDEALEVSLEQLERISTDLQGAVMTLRMVPIKQVFDRFPRMVRDLSVEKGKDVNLSISGEETELDRTIVNQIGDPLVHLLRNSVDHGIENEEVRRKNGKDPAGKISLEAHHEGSHVVVSVEDDGAGIEPEKMKEKSIDKGIISREEADTLTDDEAVKLIFRSGFSTADQVTDVSGRGVGMDVVKTSIESLNGTVEVRSEVGKGSKFILRLPLTLAIIRTLMVGSAEEIYAIPIEAISENLFVEPEELRTIQGERVITLRDEVLPIYCLEESLGMGTFQEKEVYPVVVVQAGEKKAGLVVDELMGQQEIVIKSLSNFIKDIVGVAGATVLGDGRVTLILDVASLLEDGRV